MKYVVSLNFVLFIFTKLILAHSFLLIGHKIDFQSIKLGNIKSIYKICSQLLIMKVLMAKLTLVTLLITESIFYKKSGIL